MGDMFDGYFHLTAKRQRIREDEEKFELECHPFKIQKFYFQPDLYFYKMNTQHKSFTCPECKKYHVRIDENKKYSSLIAIRDDDHEKPYNYECTLCLKKFVIMETNAGNSLNPPITTHNKNYYG